MTKREMIGWIAGKYGIVIDEDDPIFAVIGVQIALMEDFEKRIAVLTQEYEQRIKRIETGLLAKDPTVVLETALEGIRNDVRRMTEENENKTSLLIENGVKWSSDPTTKAQWWTAAAFCSLLLFSLGFMIGASR